MRLLAFSGFIFAATSALALRPEVRIGSAVEITRSHSWCWFPTVHRFRSGVLLVGMMMSPDQVNSEGAFSAFCLSRDGGLTWSRRYTMGVGGSQDGTWTEEPDEQDRLWQWGSYPEPVKEGDATRFYAAMTRFGRDGRQVDIDFDVVLRTAEPALMAPAWLYAYHFDGKHPVPDTAYTTQFGGRPWGNIIRGPRGELYTSCYYTTQDDNRRYEAEARASEHPRYYMRDVLLRSTDGGGTWAEYGAIAAVPPGERPAWMGAEGCNEGSLALLPDGRLYAVYRTGKGGTLGQGWSSDGGRTWTAPASTGFAGVAPRMHRLRDGRLILVTGRPGPVVLRVDADGNGGTWSEPVTIFAGTSTRYADAVELAPGRILVVYDSLPYGWHEIPYSDRDARNTILGTFVEIRGR